MKNLRKLLSINIDTSSHVTWAAPLSGWAACWSMRLRVMIEISVRIILIYCHNSQISRPQSSRHDTQRKHPQREIHLAFVRILRPEVEEVVIL